MGCTSGTPNKPNINDQQKKIELKKKNSLNKVLMIDSTKKEIESNLDKNQNNNQNILKKKLKSNQNELLGKIVENYDILDSEKYQNVNEKSNINQNVNEKSIINQNVNEKSISKVKNLNEEIMMKLENTNESIKPIKIDSEKVSKKTNVVIKYEKKEINKDEFNKVFKDKIFQTIILLNYDQKKFPNHPRTLYFKNEFASLPNNLKFIDESIGNYKYKYSGPKNKPKTMFLQRITIDNKNFFLGIKTHDICYTCVKKAFESNEFVILPSTSFNNLIWVDPNKDFYEYFKHLSKYQKYNHFPFSQETELKDKLYKHYMEMKNKFPNDYNYMFESFIIPDQQEEFITRVLNGKSEYELTYDNMWILKPVGTFGGSGIKLMTKLEDISGRVLASKYLSHPYLINNKKFDLRLYALVTGYKPLRIYLYKDGIVRFASEKYNLDKSNLGNLFIHLTNVCINCKYDSSGRTEKWRFKQFIEYLKNVKNLDFSPYFEKIKDIINKLFLSITDLAIQELNQSTFNTNNLFEFFGFDVILDKNLNPFLLEINNNPMLNSFKNLDQEMKTCLISDIANIIGIIPFNKEYPDMNLDGIEPVYKDKIEEAVKECLCEFDRPQGDWIRTFPLKENIDYYKKFIENPGIENLTLWDVLKKNLNI